MPAVSTIILHGGTTSSATGRVRIALDYKGLTYEFRAVDIAGGGNRSAAYLAVNPQGQVPVLEIDGHRLCQSIAILEYLEETRPESALLPADPAARAQVRHLVELVNSGIQPLQNTAVLSQLAADHAVAEPRAFAQYWIRRGLAAMEEVLATSAGRYSSGDQVTLADVVLAPQIEASGRYDIDIAGFPTIARIGGALAALPAFAAVLAPR